MIQKLAQIYAVLMGLAAPLPFWWSVLFVALMRLPAFRRAYEKEIAKVRERGR